MGHAHAEEAFFLAGDGSPPGADGNISKKEKSLAEYLEDIRHKSAKGKMDAVLNSQLDNLKEELS